jgi:glutamate decarboxylase
VDGHKQLYTPMGLGILLLKSPEDILSVAKTANYVIRKESPDLGKFTLEGSRPANILYLHACLNLLGYKKLI